MPSVLQEMKECVHIQDTAHNIYMMNGSGGNSLSNMQFLYQVKRYVQMFQQWERYIVEGNFRLCIDMCLKILSEVNVTTS